MATSCNMFCGWHSSGLVFLKVVIDSIDNVDSEGIQVDCTRFIKNSKYCGMMLKIIDKECEQADLLRKEATTSGSIMGIISLKTEFFQVRGY